MASWGTKKRNNIIFVFFVIFVSVAGYISFKIFYNPPTCFDNKQNGIEAGVDCGGSCELLCSNATLDPIVHWVRFFKVTDGIYNVLAYVENQNINAAVKNLPYKFKLYDDEGIVLAEKTGSVDLNPRQIIPITETNLNTGALFPRRVTFDFTDDVVWQKQKSLEPALIIKDEDIKFDGEVQKITAEVYNSSLQTIDNIELVVIVYDNQDNAIAASSTFLDEITGDNSVNILFTWPTEFGDDISRFEIIPLYE